MARPNRTYAGELPDTPDQIRIGPFALDECIGRGAMGEVWRAHHDEQQVEVALKVILAERGDDRRFQRAFRQETRAVAELHHPFVVDVLDYGTVDELGVESSAGRFRRGSPVLVMRHTPVGSLKQRVDGAVAWPVTRLITAALLDALAHSHARGVLHRDIKPANVLLTPPRRTVGVALTDFGLAYALRTSQNLAGWQRAAGTPAYMSPEQLTGDWRSYGPATDLYGLGCLVWKLVTGAPPYSGDNLMQITRAHLQDSAPPLPQQANAPEGLEAWLHRLLAVDPSDRFDCAADAARAFAAIARHGDRDIPSQWNDVIEDANGHEHGCPMATATYCLNPIFEQPSGDDESTTDALPQQWSRSQSIDSPAPLIDTGSGIYRLRRIPVVARQPQRDLLWKRLHATVKHRRIDATVITGPAGIGKDCLARWLCERAAELGAADVFHARHQPDGQGDDGLIRMIEREFCLDGLVRDEVHRFLRQLLTDLGVNEPYEWEVLTELLRPGDDDQRLLFTNGRQRYMALARLFEHLASHRPQLLWLEDAHLNLDTLRFVRQLLDRPGCVGPIHVVMTLRDDQLAERGLHHETADSIMKLPGCKRIELQPMTDEQTQQLIETALFIDPSTAYEVVHRAGGNPLTALETVGSWIDDEQLEPTGAGYRLREDAPATACGEWIDVWSDAVDRLVDDNSDARRALQLAAILGESFEPDVWYHAAETAGVNIPDALADTLLKHRYWYEINDRLVFSQSLLREALLQSARNHPRYKQLFGIAANALAASSPSSTTARQRIALLRAEAGDPHAAARHLIGLAEEQKERLNYVRQVYLAGRAQNLLGEPTDDVQRILSLRASCVLGHGWAGLGKQKRAIDIVDRALEVANQLDDNAWRGRLLFYKVGPTNMTGRFAEARQFAQQCRQLLETTGRFDAERARVELLLAHISRNHSDLDEALDHIEHARRLGESLNDPRYSLQAQNVELKIRMLRGDDVDPNDMERLYRQCRQMHITRGVVEVANERAELARYHGNFDTAQKWYHRSIEASRRIAPQGALAARLNLSLIDIERNNYATAADRARRIIADLGRSHRPVMMMYARAITLPRLAADGNIEPLTNQIDEVARAIEQFQIAGDHDLLLCFEHALNKLTGDDASEYRNLRNLLQPLAERMRPPGPDNPDAS